VVHESHGGQLLLSQVSAAGVVDGIHWWNRLRPGADADLTGDQFLSGELVLPPGAMRRPGRRHSKFVVMSVDVDLVRAVTPELVEAISQLLPQLSSTARPVGEEALAALIEHEANNMLIARTEGEVVGMLTLVMLPIPTGLRARIEDVVVDKAARGRDVGAALTREAVRLAQTAGARTVDLTSRPSGMPRTGCTSGWDSNVASRSSIASPWTVEPLGTG
jgi:GNAT superfamily N-acetyltransferase